MNDANRAKMMLVTSTSRSPFINMMIYLLSYPFIVPILVILIKNTTLLSATECLNGLCNCVWKGGKFTADCAALNLVQLPSSDLLPPHASSKLTKQQLSASDQHRDIQSLNMTNNRLAHLNKWAFFETNFTNVQKIFLSNNQLESIEEGAFYRLIGLVELDVSANLLTQLPTNVTYTHCLQLRILNYSHNKLTQVPSKAFNPLSELRQLSLASNQIEHIHGSAFHGLNQLNVLYLDRNKLTTIDSSVLKPLKSSIHSLTLADNLWVCDCHIRPLLTFLSQLKIRAILLDKPQCNGNGGHDYTSDMKSFRHNVVWSELDARSLQCEPTLASVTLSNSELARLEKQHQFSTNGTAIEEQEQSSLTPTTPNNADAIKYKNDRFSSSDYESYTVIRLSSPSESHYTPGEAIALTCAFDVIDHLDVSVLKIEWYYKDTLLYASSSIKEHNNNYKQQIGSENGFGGQKTANNNEKNVHVTSSPTSDNNEQNTNLLRQQHQQSLSSPNYQFPSRSSSPHDVFIYDYITSIKLNFRQNYYDNNISEQHKKQLNDDETNRNKYIRLTHLFVIPSAKSVTTLVSGHNDEYASLYTKIMSRTSQSSPQDSANSPSNDHSFRCVAKNDRGQVMQNLTVVINDSRQSMEQQSYRLYKRQREIDRQQQILLKRMVDDSKEKKINDINGQNQEAYKGSPDKMDYIGYLMKQNDRQAPDNISAPNASNDYTAVYLNKVNKSPSSEAGTEDLSSNDYIPEEGLFTSNLSVLAIPINPAVVTGMLYPIYMDTRYTTNTISKRLPATPIDSNSTIVDKNSLSGSIQEVDTREDYVDHSKIEKSKMKHSKTNDRIIQFVPTTTMIDDDSEKTIMALIGIYTSGLIESIKSFNNQDSEQINNIINRHNDDAKWRASDSEKLGNLKDAIADNKSNQYLTILTNWIKSLTAKIYILVKDSLSGSKDINPTLISVIFGVMIGSSLLWLILLIGGRFKGSAKTSATVYPQFDTNDGVRKSVVPIMTVTQASDNIEQQKNMAKKSISQQHCQPDDEKDSSGKSSTGSSSAGSQHKLISATTEKSRGPMLNHSCSNNNIAQLNYAGSGLVGANSFKMTAGMSSTLGRLSNNNRHTLMTRCNNIEQAISAGNHLQLTNDPATITDLMKELEYHEQQNNTNVNAINNNVVTNTNNSNSYNSYNHINHHCQNVNLDNGSVSIFCLSDDVHESSDDIAATDNEQSIESHQSQQYTKLDDNNNRFVLFESGANSFDDRSSSTNDHLTSALNSSTAAPAINSNNIYSISANYFNNDNNDDHWKQLKGPPIDQLGQHNNMLPINHHSVSSCQDSDFVSYSSENLPPFNCIASQQLAVLENHHPHQLITATNSVASSPHNQFMHPMSLICNDSLASAVSNGHESLTNAQQHQNYNSINNSNATFIQDNYSRVQPITFQRNHPKFNAHSCAHQPNIKTVNGYDSEGMMRLPQQMYQMGHYQSSNSTHSNTSSPSTQHTTTTAVGDDETIAANYVTHFIRMNVDRANSMDTNTSGKTNGTVFQTEVANQVNRKSSVAWCSCTRDDHSDREEKIHSIGTCRHHQQKSMPNNNSANGTGGKLNGKPGQ